MKNIVVLISGNGSNLQAILDQLHSTKSATSKNDSQVVAIFSNNADAYGLSRAQEFNIATHAIDPKEFATRSEFDQQLAEKIDTYQPDLIVLAGYMRILSPQFVNHYLGRMINIHPSLLPKYQGLHTHQRAIDANESEHGASVHFVTEELDGGPVILQAKVPVFDDDNEETLAERVLTQEHAIYAKVIAWFTQERLSMQDGKAVLDGQQLSAHGYACD